MATFKLQLRNCFQALKEEVVEPNLCTFHYWTVREAGEEILGVTEDWIKEGTWDKISEIEEMKEKIHVLTKVREKEILERSTIRGEGTRKTTLQVWLQKQKWWQELNRVRVRVRLY